LKNSSGKVLQEFMTHTNQNTFEASFYNMGINSSKVSFDFEIEGSEDVWISELTVHAATDAICREFDNGMVLVNPSSKPFTFKLEKNKYRRIDGVYNTDVNDGKLVDESLVLNAKDGLFLVKDNTMSLVIQPKTIHHMLIKEGGSFKLLISDPDFKSGYISICDCVGRRIINQKMNNNYTTFNLRGNATGVYFLSVIGNSGILSTRFINN